MRILANYGYKANGDMYSVTFETMGDVPSEHAPQAVDELFRLAKEAVQRQLAAAGPHAASQPATTVTIPQPRVAVQSPPANGNGRLSAVPRTAQAGKPQIKDPGIPASPKQLGLLRRLAREKGHTLPDLTDLTMGEASTHIEQLMAR